MQQRKEALKKYENAKKEGKVDKDIINLLDLINSFSHFYTTSSCSGRIVVISIPEIGDKKNAVFLGKWHSMVDVEDVRNAIEKYENGYLFLLMQSPIIHVVCEDLNHAKSLMQIALECGFKYTSIKKIDKRGVLIEILSTENLHIPLGIDGRIIVDGKDIEFFVEMANKMLLRSKRKLKCLERKISYLLLSSS